MLRALRYNSSAASECPCRSSNWPLSLFSSAANQRSPVLSTILPVGRRSSIIQS
jgi:hypothetical protein